MDKAELLRRGLAAGAALLRGLDVERFPYTLAFWIRESDQDEFKLLIASNIIADEGANKAFQRVRNVFSHRRVEPGTLSLSDLSIVKPEDSRVEVIEEKYSSLVREYGDIPAVLTATGGVVPAEMPWLGLVVRDVYARGTTIPEAFVYRRANPQARADAR